MARASHSGRIRPTIAMLRSGMRSSRDLNALRFGLATLEFLDDGVPVAPLAKQPFHGLAKRAVAAGPLEFPRRRLADFDGSIGWRGRNAGAKHRRKIGQIVAQVEELIEAEGEFLNEALARLQLVRRSLMQLMDAELARAAAECRRSAAGQQR